MTEICLYLKINLVDKRSIFGVLVCIGSPFLLPLCCIRKSKVNIGMLIMYIQMVWPFLISATQILGFTPTHELGLCVIYILVIF